jgi:hypothetical protein
MALKDGNYLATCKERNPLAAAVNGHHRVWPNATCVVKRGFARFKRDGDEVWSCNATYAEAHFKLEPLD